MKIFLLLQVLICSIISLNAQTNFVLKIENGVSQELADHRKKVLSNVHYSLSFVIPPNQTSPINGGIFIMFDLKKDLNPLQIDFKQDAEHIKTVSVNLN